MKKQNKIVQQLEQAILGGKDAQTLFRIHNDLKAQLREKGPSPEWEHFPKARDFFTQRYA